MAKEADSDKEWPLVHKLMGRNAAGTDMNRGSFKKAER